MFIELYNFSFACLIAQTGGSTAAATALITTEKHFKCKIYTKIPYLVYTFIFRIKSCM